MRSLIRNPVLAIAAAAFAFALCYGSFVAGGSDSYGYLSQARLWAHGTPITREPLISQVTWRNAAWTFAPLGYKPGLEAGTIVPVYSVGYPMLMGLVQKVFGPDAQMAIVPLTAAGLILCTGVIGRWAGGVEIGVLSSLLLATSPPFVLQSLQPMSDIPVTFWWTLSAVLAFSRSRTANMAAAATVAAAILTRPNLIPLAAPLAIFGFFTSRRDDGPHNWRSATAVVIGTLAGAGVTAAINTVFYGAPNVSGYGTARELYSLQYASVNLPKYAGWLIDTETVLVFVSLAGVLALALAGRFQRLLALYTIAVASVMLCSYLFYAPFNSWTYVRFLLPMYPFLFIAILSVTSSAPFLDRPRARKYALTGLTLVLLVSHARFISQWDMLNTKAGELKYPVVARYARTALPANAVFISMQHSGSIQYYAGRKTLRFDWLPARSLDEAVAQLNRLGYKPYFLLEHWEEPAFQSKFGARSDLAKLDWPATFEFRREGVRIFDPAVR